MTFRKSYKFIVAKRRALDNRAGALGAWDFVFLFFLFFLFYFTPFGGEAPAS